METQLSVKVKAGNEIGLHFIPLPLRREYFQCKMVESDQVFRSTDGMWT